MFTCRREVQAKFAYIPHKGYAESSVPTYLDIAPTFKSAHLRFFSSDLTGDISASTNALQAEVDSRIKQLIDLEDPNVVSDLKTLNSSTERAKFDRFWQECVAVLSEDFGVAVDDRQHTEVTFLATALSVKDPWERVSTRLPEGTALPSQEWLRLQFWLKIKRAKLSLFYTGHLKVKFMVQQ